MSSPAQFPQFEAFMRHQQNQMCAFRRIFAFAPGGVLPSLLFACRYSQQRMQQSQQRMRMLHSSPGYFGSFYLFSILCLFFSVYIFVRKLTFCTSQGGNEVPGHSQAWVYPSDPSAIAASPGAQALAGSANRKPVIVRHENPQNPRSQQPDLRLELSGVPKNLNPGSASLGSTLAAHSIAIKLSFLEFQHLRENRNRLGKQVKSLAFSFKFFNLPSFLSPRVVLTQNGHPLPSHVVEEVSN